MHHPNSDRSAYPAIPTILALIGIVILLVALFVMDADAEQDTGLTGRVLNSTLAIAPF